MKAVIIYWSGTGVTEGVANNIKDAMSGAGHEVEAYSVSDFTGSVDAYDLVLLGCSAQGAEVLEEGEFQPFYDSIKSSLAGKKVGLFGAYGWGDGEWMREWLADAQGAGIDVLTGEGLSIQEDDIDQSVIAAYVAKLG